MRKLVLVVVDGLTADAFEAAVDARRTPALAFLAEHGRYRRAVSTFPSLTPVCLASIATGAHPEGHEIPHLVWYHRREGRIVEYGSSFRALRAAGLTRSIRDAVVEMSASHLGRGVTTVFEAVADAGRTPAAVNFNPYRGRTRHRAVLPGVPPVAGPRRFFFYNLFDSDVTGAPLAVRKRAAGTVDGYAAAVGRWLVTRDGFDFLAYYLSDFDYASHALGPQAAAEALPRTDAHVGALFDAAGGPDEFLQRYDVIVCSDHGQSPVSSASRLGPAFADLPVLVTASNRAGMVYLLDAALEPAALARRLDGHPAVELTLYREDGRAVARREGAEVRLRPADGGWTLEGDASVLDFPHGLERAWSALANPNAGELVVSARPGFEFEDLGGRHHAGGGSHGSLCADDSTVPMLTVGAGDPPESITGVAPLVREHLAVSLPAGAGTNRA
ncbi:MAG: alkaline phosphatase family protein [Thermoleophilia bacterium]|nr:alkaline phosphatase family protein [Thermoleophilia bacterium]